jgi:hypothetical protein
MFRIVSWITIAHCWRHSTVRSKPALRWSVCDYRRGMDWTLHLLTTCTRLGTTSNCSATAYLHNSQITTAPARPFSSLLCLQQSFPSKRLLTVDILQLPALKSSLSSEYPETDPFPSVSRTELHWTANPHLTGLPYSFSLQPLCTGRIENSFQHYCCRRVYRSVVLKRVAWPCC